MSSHETIGWIITDNYVKDRMIDNSLIYKFTPSPKIRRRTKALNAKIKKYCGVKDYKQYVKLKTDVVRNMIEDNDTDNSGNLSDTDYDIIYSSSIQNKHSIDNPERYIFTEKDCEDFKRKINSKEENNIKNIKASTPKRKLSQPTCNTRSSKKCINIKNIAKVETITSENSKDVNNDNILEKQNNEKEKNSSRSNLINKKIKNQKISLTNQENKTKFVKTEKSIQKQQSLSLKKNDAKNVHSKSCDNILEEEDGREEESSDGKVRNFLQLNEIDKDAEICLINQEDKNDLLNQSIVSYKNMHSMESEDSSDNHKQRSLFPKKDQVKDVHSKSCDNILEEQNSREEESSDGKITNSLLNEIDKDAEIYLINRKDKNDLLDQSIDSYKKTHSTEPEDSSDIHKQRSLFPKKDRIKNVHSKSCDNILEGQDSKEEETSDGKVRNSLQLNEIDKNAEIYLINREDKNDLLNQSTDSYKKTHSTDPEDLSDIHEERSLFPKEDRVKDVHSKSCDNILKEQDSRKEESFEEEITDFFQSNQMDKDTEIYSINHQDEKHSVKLKDSCNIEKQQFLPKITYSEIINKKYTIINKQDNNINIEKNDINSQKEMSKVEELDNNVLITLETDNEEDNANYISPETKKRLQQQAKLNLVVNSDSSQSNDEYITSKTLEKFDDSDTSCCSKDMLENDETNCEKIDTDILHNKDSICSKETTPVPTKEKEDSPNIKNEIRKKDETVLLANCTYENNNLSKSTASKNSLNEIQYCENVYNNDDQNESFIEEEESFQLRVSENYNISCDNEESTNQFSKNKSLDKENFCDKSNQSEDRMSDCTSELGAQCKPRHEQNKQVSTNHSNVQLNISSYRPYNLQQLVEDEKLLAETIPASFMLADICEDDEAFILNVPNNVLQCNLQGQLLSLKEKTIKFGENKYRIVRRKVGTVSCIFATGKQRRPYKTVNIKEISTITVREKLSHCLKSDISNSYDTIISFESESPNINNKLTNELQKTASKIKIDHNKRKRRSSDLETEQFASTKRTKKGRLKLFHS